jgi:Tfp pilus assembly protein PilO
MVRVGLGVLLAANLIAAWFVFQTPGGTLEQLELDMSSQRNQLVSRERSLERLKRVVEKATSGREEGDRFMAAYFLPRRTTYSMLEVDLALAAQAAGIKGKERTYSYEPVEGSDTLGMLNINANFEGTYADLIELVNAIDRSKRLIILEQLQAQPQQGSEGLAISLKLNAFFRMDGPEAPESADEMELLKTAAVTPKALPDSAAAPGAAKPALAAKPVVKPPVQSPQVSEPRSGPAGAPPRRPTFRRPSRGEEEQ